MKYSDIEYQNDTINNALHRLYMMNEKFNVHFPSLKDNLEFYKNKKKCNHLQLEFLFYCIISFLLMVNIFVYYDHSLSLVSSFFILVAFLWAIIYYYYSYRISDLPSFIHYLFLINFLIYTIFLLLTPIGNDDFVIIPERIIIVLKVAVCIFLFINYFQFFKQIENEYLFLDVLDNLITEPQIEFEKQDEIYEDNVINEIQEDNFKVSLENNNVIQNEELSLSDNTLINKNNLLQVKPKKIRKEVKTIDDVFNLFRSIMPPEEANKIPFKEFFYDYIAKEYSEHDFIGYNFHLRYKEGQLFKIYKNGKEEPYDYKTLEQHFSKYCKLAQL